MKLKKLENKNKKNREQILKKWEKIEIIIGMI